MKKGLKLLMWEMCHVEDRPDQYIKMVKNVDNSSFVKMEVTP